MRNFRYFLTLFVGLAIMVACDSGKDGSSKSIPPKSSSSDSRLVASGKVGTGRVVIKGDVQQEVVLDTAQDDTISCYFLDDENSHLFLSLDKNGPSEDSSPVQLYISVKGLKEKPIKNEMKIGSIGKGRYFHLETNPDKGIWWSLDPSVKKWRVIESCDLSLQESSDSIEVKLHCDELTDHRENKPIKKISLDVEFTCDSRLLRI